MKVVPRSQTRTMLANLTAAGALLDDAVIRCFVNDFDPSPESVLADFTEASFAGYAASAEIDWGEPYSDLLGNGIVEGCAAQFTAGSVTTPETVYGYYVTKSGVGGALVYSERFNTPVPITQSGDGFAVTPRFAIPAQLPQ